MSRIAPSPTALFVTGDIPGHDYPHQTMSSNLHYLETVISSLKKYFPSSPSLFSLGNHDAWPTDQLAKPPWSNWLLDPTSLSFLSNGWLSVNASTQYGSSGYYSVEFEAKKLRVISLETQWVSGANRLIPRWKESHLDPMLGWLISEIDQARQLHQKVILLGHIIPRVKQNDSFEGWVEWFADFMESNSDVIVLSLFGHIHHDRFGLIRSKDSNEVKSFYVVGGSVTTHQVSFPTVKLILYNRTSLSLLDIETYFVNLTKANSKGTMQLEFEYSMKETHNMSAFDASDFERVYTKLVSKEGESSMTEKERFFKYYSGSSDEWKKCGSKCQEELLCDVGFLRTEGHQRCLEEKQMLMGTKLTSQS